MKKFNNIVKIASLSLVAGSLLVPALSPAAPAGAEAIEIRPADPQVFLCAKADPRSVTGLRNNGRIMLRTACSRSEVSIGTVADLAMVGEKREVLESMDRVDKDGSLDNGRETLRFTGVNVQVVSGAEATDEDLAKSFSGLGNLIVGYDEGASSSKSGSHNLVVGEGHEYSSHSGIVAGAFNRVTGARTVALGTFNVASGLGATITGGTYNTADGQYATVTSGLMNEASAIWTTASGGRHNVASASYATTSGGADNTANAEGTVVSGGKSNTAGGICVETNGGGAYSSDWKVGNACQKDSECSDNSVCKIGHFAVVAGGENNTATAWAATVTAGSENNSFADYSAIQGGVLNRTSGHCEGGDITIGKPCVSDGECRYGGVCRGGEFAAISAGSHNRTQAWASSIIGGTWQRGTSQSQIQPKPVGNPVDSWDGVPWN